MHHKARHKTQLLCRLCGSPSSAVFQAEDRNRGLGPTSFDYGRCGRCRSVFIQRVPSDIGRYYASGGYGSRADVEVAAFKERELAKLALVQRFVAGGSLVEIGPGPGMFAQVAKHAGFAVSAIEMDARYCRALRDEIGVSAIQSIEPAEALANLGMVDAVVLWHAIEHLAHPWRVLAAAVEHLRPGGLLAISTPNPDSLQARLLGRYWAHLDAPRHLQLIPHRTLCVHTESLGANHVLTTTTDPVGLECNRLGWEYAVRVHPSKHGSGAGSMRVASLLTRVLGPFERRGMAGSTYTALFLRTADKA